MTKLELLNKMLSDNEIHSLLNSLQYLSADDIENCYKAYKISKSGGISLLKNTALLNRINGKKPSQLYYYHNGKKHNA